MRNEKVTLIRVPSVFHPWLFFSVSSVPLWLLTGVNETPCATPRSKRRLADPDVVEIRRHLELVLAQRRLHGLPVRRRLNELPVVLGADAHRHRKQLLVRLPAIRDRA